MQTPPQSQNSSLPTRTPTLKWTRSRILVSKFAASGRRAIPKEGFTSGRDGDEPLRTMETADRRLSTLVHKIKPVRCSDSGLYSCEVEGTDQYRTVTMLVRCKYDTVNGRYSCKYTRSDCRQCRYQYTVTGGSTGISIQ